MPDVAWCPPGWDGEARSTSAPSSSELLLANDDRATLAGKTWAHDGPASFTHKLLASAVGEVLARPAGLATRLLARVSRALKCTAGLAEGCAFVLISLVSSSGPYTDPERPAARS